MGASLPMDMFVSSILSGVFNTIQASERGVQPRNYLLVNLIDAPARWPMDLVLRPKDDSLFVPNPMIVTRFNEIPKNPLEMSFEYATHKISGINFPSIWGTTTPGPRGSERKIADLAQNTCIIRGCNMGIDGHVRNNMRLAAPNQDGLSIGGQVADFSSRPIPTILLSGEMGFDNNAASAFKSKLGKIPIDIDDRVDDYFKFLIDPFYSKNVLGFRGNAVRKEFVQKSTDLIRFHLKRAGSDRKFQTSRKNIERLIEKSLETLDRDYQILVNKYSDLVSRSLRNTRIPGVTDRAIPGFELPISVKKERLTRVVEDVLGMYKNESEFLGEKDLRTIYDTSEIINLANQFAIAELSFKNNLTNSIVLNVNPITHLNYQRSYAVSNLELSDGPNPRMITLKNPNKILKSRIRDNHYEPDAHRTGTIPTLVGSSLLFRALSSCLLEFTDQLKAAGLFNETLIHMAGEFDREPRKDHSGSEHGWTGHTSTLISGIIQKPQVIGNIYSDSISNTDFFKNSGTWGKGAPVAELGRTLNYGNIASSIASILRVPSPISNEKSILAVKSGRLRPLIEEAKNLGLNKEGMK
jgi:hypothetical protein